MAFDPYRRLAAAVLVQAAQDARSRAPEVAGPARRWLADEGAALAEMIDLPAERVTAFLGGLDPLAQMSLW